MMSYLRSRFPEVRCSRPRPVISYCGSFPGVVSPSHSEVGAAASARRLSVDLGVIEVS